MEPSDEEVGLHLLIQADPLVSELSQVALPLQEHEYLHQVTHVRNQDGSITKRSHQSSPYRFLVLYCGTGSVEAMLLKLFPNAEITALDIDPRSSATMLCDVREWVDHPDGMRQYAPRWAFSCNLGLSTVHAV